METSTDNQLPPLWKTKRLTVRDAVEDDVPALQKIYDDCAYVNELTGNHDDRKNPILMEVRHETLPPNGRKELHRIQAITITERKEIVGYIIIYHGYPDPDTLWIGLFAIAPTSHRKGIGKEVIAALRMQAAELGTFTRIGLGISIGNNAAKAFWIQCGFVDVIKIENHGTHSDEWVVQSLER